CRAPWLSSFHLLIAAVSNIRASVRMPQCNMSKRSWRRGVRPLPELCHCRAVTTQLYVHMARVSLPPRGQAVGQAAEKQSMADDTSIFIGASRKPDDSYQQPEK